MNANHINIEQSVIVTGKGDHFHLFNDCRALWRGRLNSEKFGHDLWAEDVVAYGDAVVMGKFACIVCHDRADLEVPVNASRKAFRAANRAKRAAKAEAKAAALAPVASVASPAVEVPSTIDETVSAADVEALIAELTAMLARLNVMA